MVPRFASMLQVRWPGASTGRGNSTNLVYNRGGGEIDGSV